MAKKTLESVLAEALKKGWIDQERADSFRKHHPDISLDALVKTIAEEASLALKKTILTEL